MQLLRKPDPGKVVDIDYLMENNLTEAYVKMCLTEAYQPGRIASSDGYPFELLDLSSLKCASVLIPLCWDGTEWHLLFTRRTDIVDSHKGQVSFPGGACDLGEEEAEQTALREVHEEIGVRPEDVRILGRMNDIVTITQFRVTPVVGVIPWPYVFKVAVVEVGRVFTMPLRWLATPMNRWEFSRPESGLRLIAFHPFDGELLWGATARMTVNFLEALKLL